MRYPMPSTASGTALLIAARTCSSFGRTASGCAAMYSSTDLGTLSFIRLFYVSRAESEAVVGQPCFNVLPGRVHQKPSSETSVTGHFLRDEVRDCKCVRLRRRVKLRLSQDESFQHAFEHIDAERRNTTADLGE